MPHTHDNVTYSSIDDVRCSCARAPALATGFPITCRRLGFRSGCCKYVEQCKTAIYWDLALDFTLVRLAAYSVAKDGSPSFFVFFRLRSNNVCTKSPRDCAIVPKYFSDEWLQHLNIIVMFFFSLIYHTTDCWTWTGRQCRLINDRPHKS